MRDVSEFEYVRELVGKAPVLAFVKDAQGRYLYVNDAWLAFTGLTNAAVLGRSDHDLFEREVADGFVVNDRRVLTTGETIDAEEMAPSVHGGVRVGHVTKFALRDAAGRIDGVGGIAVDITDRYVAQQALTRSEARYRALVEHSPEAVMVLDPHLGAFVEANDNACRFFKMPRERLLRMNPTELSPATQVDGRASAEAAAGYVAQVLADQAAVFEWIHQAADGELLPCRIWLAKVQLATGPGVRASIVDMREIESVRSVLERTRAQLDAVQDALPQLVAVYDPTTGGLVHCNRTYRATLGKPPALPLWESASDACEQALTAGTAHVERLLTTSRGDRRQFVVDISVFQRASTGVPTRLLLVGNDVTEQREMDAHLRQARRLESLGRLAGGVAHDFNNLLTVILGSADFLEPSLEGDPTAMQDLGALRDAAEQAKLLTTQLLTFAKSQSGRAEVVDVDALVSRALRVLRRLLGEDIVTDVSLAAPEALVLIDRSQLEQILVNLGVNARDAMSGCGALKIATKLVEMREGTAPGALRAGRYVEILFEDSGVGMSADVVDKAFEPFFTTKPVHQGTGLGLSTVHGIVQQAGGHVAIASKPGHGTTISVWLPIYDRTVEVPSSRRPVLSAGEPCQVLLVEDDEGVRAVNARALRRAGHAVTSVPNPLAALELVDAGQRFQVVVTDVVMPGMSGLELAERLLGVLGPVPVVFVSGYAADALRARGVNAQDINLLPKPFAPGALVERVNLALQGECP